MGQQQLLLIVLSTIIVGIAIFGGLRLMGSYNQSNERDLVIQQMNIVVGEAIKYAAKSRNLGGGDGSFEGFAPLQRLSTTERVRLYTTAGDDWIILQGFGNVTGWDGDNPVQVVAQFTKVGNASSITTVN